MALRTSITDAYLEELMALPQFAHNPNKVSRLLCALRDTDDRLANTYVNYLSLMRYFTNTDYMEFVNMLDSVSALASDDELSLLVGVHLTLRRRKFRLESASGVKPT